MSLALEEGTAKQLSRELKPGTKSSRSGAEIINGIRSTRELAKSCFRILARIIDPERPCGNEIIALILCMGAAFLDPMFFYTRVTDDNNNCVRLENSLGITATILRSLSDVFYIFCYSSALHELSKRERIRFFMDIFTILPLPQAVVILSMFKSTRRKGIWNALYVLIVQHALRSFRVATLLTERRTTGTFSEWAIVFMLSYMYASHMFGALWYYTAIGREIEFWESSFRKEIGCTHYGYPYCDDNKHQDDCHKKLNTTTYDFGIYSDARKYGILHMTDYKRKVFYCFRWGLQNLSCFGQSLNTGTDLEENLYIISITLTGVLLFFFLIARMQVYLQSETIRLEETKRKLQEIQQWMPFQKLSGNLQQQVKKYLQQDAWQETKGVNIEILLNTLPEDLKRNIKHKLCIELLKSVEEFASWSELETTILEDLCNCMKPVFYIERTRIVREGDPIDEMLFVLQGNLWTFTSRGIKTATPSTDHLESENYHLKDGDLFGEELVNWAQLDDPSSSNLPISTRSVKALTNVEAFVLIADDLKSIIIKHNQELVSHIHTRLSSRQESGSEIIVTQEL